MKLLRYKVDSKAYQRLTEISNQVAREIDQFVLNERDLMREEARVARRIRKLSWDRSKKDSRLILKNRLFELQYEKPMLKLLKIVAVALVAVSVVSGELKDEILVQTKGVGDFNHCKFTFHQMRGSLNRQVSSHEFDGHSVPLQADQFIFISVSCLIKQTLHIHIDTGSELKTIKILLKSSGRLFQPLGVKGYDIRQLWIDYQGQQLGVPFHLIEERGKNETNETSSSIQ